jgi:hypothetical protein
LFYEKKVKISIIWGINGCRRRQAVKDAKKGLLDWRSIKNKRDRRKKRKRRREVQDLLSFLKRKSDKYPEELEVDARARNTIIAGVY